MPKLTFPATGEAMPAAEVMPIVGRFSGRVILGDVAVQMAAAALQIERDTASIAAALAIIHGGQYRVQISHDVEYVMVVRS